MNASLLNEDRLSFRDLARQENVNPATVWRWCSRGCKGHKLECFHVGGRTYTTRAAYKRWLAKINGGDSPARDTPKRRQREVKDAEQELVALGA
jgi:hypothetical protein